MMKITHSDHVTIHHITYNGEAYARTYNSTEPGAAPRWMKKGAGGAEMPVNYALAQLLEDEVQPHLSEDEDYKAIREGLEEADRENETLQDHLEQSHKENDKLADEVKELNKTIDNLNLEMKAREKDFKVSRGELIDEIVGLEETIKIQAAELDEKSGTIDAPLKEGEE